MKNKVVLFVDDEKSLYECIETYFDKEIVMWLRNGEESLRAMDYFNKIIKIVFVDYDMPGLNGVEVIKEIRQKGYKHKVYMLSGNSSIKNTALKVGADGFIEKPFDLGVLEGLVGEGG
jgi:DNA-binding response OmpR family regulator